jgi:hypothetical protein
MGITKNKPPKKGKFLDVEYDRLRATILHIRTTLWPPKTTLNHPDFTKTPCKNEQITSQKNIP